MSWSTMFYPFTTILFVLIVMFFLRQYFYDFNYWKRRGVPFRKPLPLFGNMLEVFTMKLSLYQLLAKIYSETKTPYLGLYMLNKPCFVPISPKMIQTVLVKDFNYFCDRNVFSSYDCDPVFSNLLAVIKNPEWKLLRTKISPLFTTGKLKSMWHLMSTTAEAMDVYIGKHVGDEFIEAKELCAKYTTDVIASCALGIDAYSFEHDNTEFREVGRKIFEFNWKIFLRQACYFLAPPVVKLLKLPFFDVKIVNFTREVFWTTINQREATKIPRNDLVDILIDIKNKPNDDLKFEGDRVVAQAFTFFAAGFETTSTTMAFALYEICLHPEVQDKLRLEIQTVVSQHGGSTYDAIHEMKYLHMVLLETMRMYPSIPFVDRVCVKNFKLPDSDVVIEKGTAVFVSIYGIQRDAKYFPEPEKFDPERFSDENKAKIASCTYLAFGEGPHGCIGERFGLTTAKIGLARVILNYELERCAATPVPVVIETKCSLLAARGGLPIKFKKIISD